MKIKVYKFIAKEEEFEINNISDNQIAFINKIEEYKKEYKTIPTIRKIGKLVGYKSSASTFYMLKELEKKGYHYDMV